MIYLVMSLFILGMNTAPAFMPPTWVVLTFFYIHFHLNLWLTVFLGAVSATMGRIALFYLSKRYLNRFLPKKINQNYQGLGEFIQNHQKLTIPVVITYAFLPIPSNNVFILAGLTDLNIKIIAFSFFLGRLISYTLWVSVAYQVSTKFESIFQRHLTSTSGITVEFLSILIVLLLGQINWRRIFKK